MKQYVKEALQEMRRFKYAMSQEDEERFIYWANIHTEEQVKERLKVLRTIFEYRKNRNKLPNMMYTQVYIL